MLDMENEEFEFILEKALNSNQSPSEALVQRTKQRMEEQYMNLKPNSKMRISLIAAVIIIILTTTGFAAWTFLKPEEVAKKTHNPRLESFIKSKYYTPVNQTKTDGDYEVTLLGFVSGKGLSSFMNFSEEELKNMTFGGDLTAENFRNMEDPNKDKEHTATIIAIKNEKNKVFGRGGFYVTPLVNGDTPLAPPKNALGSMSYDENDVMYLIHVTDTIEPFADQKISLLVHSGFEFNSGSFNYSENSNDLSVNPAFEGVNLMFELPVDQSKADPAKAEKILKRILEEKESVK
jgi:hypothetical protein